MKEPSSSGKLPASDIQFSHLTLIKRIVNNLEFIQGKHMENVKYLMAAIFLDGRLNNRKRMEEPRCCSSLNTNPVPHVVEKNF